MVKSFSFTITLSLCLGFEVSSLWGAVAFPEPKPELDSTTEFHTLTTELKKSQGQNFAAGLSDTHVLIVPGFFSQQLRHLRSVGFTRKTKNSSYFGDQIEWFEQVGITYSIAEIESEGSSYYNSGIIDDTIAKINKPLVVLSQSKGGLDFLHALVTRPYLKKKSVGWIALHAPFWGTPVADFFMSYWWLRAITGTVMEAFGGTIDGVRSVTTDYTARFQELFRKDIESLSESMAVLSVASHKPNIPGWDTNHEPLRNLLEDFGYENDGIIPWKSSILPGAPFVALKGVDHTSFSKPNRFLTFDHLNSTKALFEMIDRRKARKDLLK